MTAIKYFHRTVEIAYIIGEKHDVSLLVHDHLFDEWSIVRDHVVTPIEADNDPKRRMYTAVVPEDFRFAQGQVGTSAFYAKCLDARWWWQSTRDVKEYDLKIVIEPANLEDEVLEKVVELIIHNPLDIELGIKLYELTARWADAFEKAMLPGVLES